MLELSRLRLVGEKLQRFSLDNPQNIPDIPKEKLIFRELIRDEFSCWMRMRCTAHRFEIKNITTICAFSAYITFRRLTM